MTDNMPGMMIAHDKAYFTVMQRSSEIWMAQLPNP
jgi:hypothetical protein